MLSALLVILFGLPKMKYFSNGIYFCKTITGHGRGEGLGFPTINLIIPNNFPFKFGIYAGWIIIGESKIKAAIHYGKIPTFKTKNVSLEVYAINAQINQRPEEVGIQIVQKIRDIKKFNKPTDLKKQIALDIKKIRLIIQ